MKKRLLSLLLCLMMLAGLTVPAMAAEDEKVIIWAATSDVKVIMEDYFAKAYPDIPFEVVLYSGSDYTTKLDALITANSSECPDIISAEVSYGKRYVNMENASTSLYALGITEDELSVLTPATVDFMRDETAAPKGISWQVTPGGLYYRRSIAQKYFGVSEPEDFQALVKDWPTFVETAQKLYELSDGEAKMLATTDDFIYPFVNGARTQGWVVDGKLVIDDAMKTVLEYAKLFHDEGYTQETTLWTTSWYNTLTSGETLCYLLPTWGLNYQLEPNCTAADGATSYGDWGLVKAPSPYTYGGTWLLCTTKNPAKYENVATIMRYVMSEDFQKAYATDTGDFVSNIAAQQEVAKTCSSGFLGGQNHYEVFMDIAAAVDPTIQTEYDGYIQGYFQNCAIYTYVHFDYPMEDALEYFKEEVDLYYDGLIEVYY